MPTARRKSSGVRRRNRKIHFRSRKRGRKYVRRSLVRRRSASTKALSRGLRKLSRKVAHLPTLQTRKWSMEWAVAKPGVVNQWAYYNVDNMNYSDNGTVIDAFSCGLGWNYFYTLYAAAYQIKGAAPVTGDRLVFTKRKMSTLFQSPTATPTFVEVYLLKPKVAFNYFVGRTTGMDPLNLADVGTLASSSSNPGDIHPYTYNSGTSIGGAYNSYAQSLIMYNPFYDRNNMKDRFKVVKKWKFVLGPTTSKVITLRSNKKFYFRPSMFDSAASTSMGGTLTPYPIGSTGSAFDCVSSSRIMIVRWHGFSAIDETSAAVFGSRYTGMTQDPLVVRRWYHSEGYRVDDSGVEVHAFDRKLARQYDLPAANNLKSYSDVQNVAGTVL